MAFEIVNTTHMILNMCFALSFSTDSVEFPWKFHVHSNLLKRDNTLMLIPWLLTLDCHRQMHLLDGQSSPLQSWYCVCLCVCATQSNDQSTWDACWSFLSLWKVSTINNCILITLLFQNMGRVGPKVRRQSLLWNVHERFPFVLPNVKPIGKHFVLLIEAYFLFCFHCIMKYVIFAIRYLVPLDIKYVWICQQTCYFKYILFGLLSKLLASLMRNNCPKWPSGALFNTLSKLYDVPVGFVPSSFEAVYCFICGRQRVAVARYRMICLVFVIVFQIKMS